ncbi:alanine racemase [Devosia sp. ZB163]|uniref:alanine racemase n=1 Tax=Devosia sp. ZB163 TaxID=3025938 RepID=UPI00235EAB2A|nr:alanine racemase [Devosia sp. ZB163]MDC9824021.1 alanine racemase [Devosia sp. ZB163]
MAAPAIATGYGGRLTVDLGALKRNWQALDKVSRGALTGAVVKADAYGTGIAQASRAFYEAGARFFFAATPDEGIAVRAALPEDSHIFILSGLYPGSAPLYVGERLMPCLASIPMLEEWLAACLQSNQALPAALHFDTGINRLGFRLNETSIVKRMIEQIGYQPQMIMSHLACADTPAHEKNRTQLALFTSVMAQFPGVPASLSNSAGLMTNRENHFQMVRPGIALYGGRAVAGRRNPMSPVVTLEAPILMTKDVKTGETVGYGALQTVSRDSRIAVVALGYADGFFRALSSSNNHRGTSVVIRGQACPVVGRISMDMFGVDITDLPQPPAPGEMAEVIGKQVTVDDHADIANTIGYEILTSLKGRYSRNYIETAAPSA